MPFLGLRPGVSFGSVGDQLVFLDLPHDRYFAMRGEAATIFRRLAEQPADPLGVEAADRLLATGLFIACEAPGPIRPAPSHVPEVSLVDEVAPEGPPHLPTLVEIAARLVPIRRAIARRQVPERLRRIARLKAAATGSNEPGDIVRHALRFAASRPLVPVPPNCLSDSLALAEYLLRRNCVADLLFGVKLGPFAAHAWVQTDTAILSDSADRVGEFTPILVA